MKYDLIADFYTKKGSKKPRYSVLMGTYCPKTINEMEELGFVENPDSTPGYIDYIKSADEGDLMEFTKDGYISEMMDILYNDIDYSKILIRALELEPMDDEGNYPIRGVMMGDTFVSLDMSDPDCPITFMFGDPYEFTQDKRWFSISVYELKSILKVPTLLAAIEKLQKMSEKKEWSFDELNAYFKKNVNL